MVCVCVGGVFVCVYVCWCTFLVSDVCEGVWGMGMGGGLVGGGVVVCEGRCE